MENNISAELFIADAEAAVQAFPGLQLVAGERPMLTGTISLYDEDGNVADEYEVRIEHRPGYPYLFPYVFETGSKIPVNVEWHVFESDGHLCICTTTDEYVKTAAELPLSLFIQTELIPYLFNQTHRRLTGFFLHEMPHGEKGELATLKVLLKTNEITNVRWLLKRILNGARYERTSMCFCGSKLKYRYCHRQAVDTFRAIGIQKLQNLIELVENTVEFQQTI